MLEKARVTVKATKVRKGDWRFAYSQKKAGAKIRAPENHAANIAGETLYKVEDLHM